MEAERIDTKVTAVVTQPLQRQHAAAEGTFELGCQVLHIAMALLVCYDTTSEALTMHFIHPCCRQKSCTAVMVISGCNSSASTI